MIEKEIFSTKDLADYLNVSPCTIWRWRREDKIKIPYFYMGSVVKYRRRDVEAFINKKVIGLDKKAEGEFL